MHDALSESFNVFIDIVFMLPLTWLVAGLPLPMYASLNALAIATHTAISVGLVAAFVGNGLLVGSCLDKLLHRSRRSPADVDQVTNTTANKPRHDNHYQLPSFDDLP